MNPSYLIDRCRHQARSRRAMEWPNAGPQLPQLGDRPRHYVDSRGFAYSWVNALGRYVSID